MDNKNLIFYIIGIILLIGVGFMFLKYSNLFVITENDLVRVQEVIINPGESYENFTNFTIQNGTISFKVGTSTQPLYNNNVLFMVDNSPTIYTAFPEMTDGTHTINKYQMFIINSGTQINIQKFTKTFDVIVKTIVHNVTVANQTFYVDKIVYQNQTVVEYQNQTVEKQILVEPTMNYIFQKYQMQIIGIIAVGLVYYLTRKKRR